MYQERLVLLTARRETSLGAYLRKNDLRMVVLRAGCSYRLILESWLAHRGIVGVRILEFGTLEAIIGCVEAGLGMTLLPEALVGQVWRDERVAVHPLPNDYGHVDTLFIRRRDSFQSSALKALLALVSPAVRPTPDGQAASFVAQAVKPTNRLYPNRRKDVRSPG